MELYKCVGDYITYLITTNQEIPSAVHIIPLAIEHFYTAPGDPGPTIYPGKDLPDVVLEKLEITRNARHSEFSKYVWARIFLLMALLFTNKHKKKHISMGLPFCMALFHPDDHGLLFRQDIIIGYRGKAIIPDRRRDYVKTLGKVQASALYAFTCDDNGLYTGIKICDLEGRYAMSEIKFHKSIFEEGGETNIEIVPGPANRVKFPQDLLNNYG
jgi:hypothetical protein